MNATVITVQAVLRGEPRSADETDEIADDICEAVGAFSSVARAVVVASGIASVAPPPPDITNEPAPADDEPF